MDWHLVDVDPQYGSGWTGYSWNRELFPDPAELPRGGCTSKGLRVTFNVHPADGVRAFEDVYPRDGQGARSGSGVGRSDCLRRHRSGVPHRLFRDPAPRRWSATASTSGGSTGSPGPHSRVAGIDPLWMLNHFHFLDNARDGKRPLTFSRYAGPGSHRYPVGFSGDSLITWASLDFQPYFTATASNIGYGWWSHDIGGHMFGSKDDELATRWVQLGVFSPILRLHSGLSPFNTKEPWRFGPEARAVMTEFLRLRHRLVPYLHTMNHRAAAGEPLVQPMYWSHPTDRDAYQVPNQFMFGTELLVAPITAPKDQGVQVGSVRAWLPEGVWVDLLSGLRVHRWALCGDASRSVFNPGAGPRRSHRAADRGAGPGQRDRQPGRARGAGGDRRRRVVRVDRGRRHRFRSGRRNGCPNPDLVRSGVRIGDGGPGGRCDRLPARPAQLADHVRRNGCCGGRPDLGLDRRRERNGNDDDGDRAGECFGRRRRADPHAAGERRGRSRPRNRTMSPAGSSRCSTGRTSSTRRRRTSTPWRRPIGRWRCGCRTCRHSVSIVRWNRRSARSCWLPPSHHRTDGSRRSDFSSAAAANRRRAGGGRDRARSTCPGSRR